MKTDRLIAALNKFGVPVTRKQFWDDWDSEITNAAIAVAQFPKEVEDFIWVKKRQPFEGIERIL